MRKLYAVLGVLIVISMVLTACQQATTPTEAPAVEETAVATAAPTEAPVVATTRHGGWLDEIVVSVVAADSAVTQIQAGAIDIYADGLSSADVPAIEEAGLPSKNMNGLYYDILYNPAVFTDTTILNPFSNRKIREATNWLYDRDYINQEVYAGGGLAKFFAIQTQGPDYADLAATVRQLESYYAFDEQKGIDAIKTEMEGMGAELVDGKWAYNGAPVVLKFLIRTDSDGTRKPIGDYVGAQLEKAGFTVDLQYKTSSEASPIWRGDPYTGDWNLYTAAWSSNIIDRDESNMFQEMYLPSSAQGENAWLANVPDPAFQDLGDALATGNYTDLADRKAKMEEALTLSLQDSFQVWLIDGKNYVPFAEGVEVTADLAAGVQGAQIYPLTLRWADQEGGTLKWASSDLFTEPWNPVQGSNWAWDQGAMRALNGLEQIYDPYTGLIWPIRVESGAVTVQTGSVVGKTLDWVSLDFADEIVVPEDAWVDWDATAQTFITAGDKFPDGITAKRKAVITFEPDVFEVKWHDGSKMSMADMMLSWIITFDRGKPESKLYDESYAFNLDAFLETFKGFKIISTDPLTVEYYSDLVYQDAELMVGNAGVSMWPTYAYGEGAFSSIGIGVKTEEEEEAYWSTDKATLKEGEQISFVGGPTLDILSTNLDEAIADGYIPYAPTLSQYITADEAIARYEALKAFYATNGNYYVGTGPYYLQSAKLTEKIAVLKTWSEYPDLSDRWSQFTEPKLATASVTAPAEVKIGDAAEFEVAITYKDEPYTLTDIKEVKYMLYNEKGELVELGNAEGVADGQFKVALSAESTAKLEAGSCKLEVAVIPLPVSVPAFSTVDFVAVP